MSPLTTKVAQICNSKSSDKKSDLHFLTIQRHHIVVMKKNIELHPILMTLFNCFTWSYMHNVKAQGNVFLYVLHNHITCVTTPKLS